MPWFSLYPGDWKRQTSLMTHEEKGILADLRCILHDMEDRGKLTIGGEPVSLEEASLLLFCSSKTLSKTLAKGSATGAAKIEPNTGMIYDPRMVEEESERVEKQRISDMRSEIGKKGGNMSATKRKATAQANGNRLYHMSPSKKDFKKLRGELLSEPDPIQSVKKAAFEIVRGRDNARHVFSSGKGGSIDAEITGYIERMGVATLVDDLLGLVGRDIEFPIKYCTTRQEDEEAPRWEMMARERKWQETKDDESIGEPIRRLLGGPGDKQSDS